MSITYEGLTLEWYAFVPILILACDILFIIATVLNLIYSRNERLIFWIHIFSMVLIGIALVMKVFDISYPAWGVVIWDFYMAYFYGLLVIRNIIRKSVV
jgi:hypothetical protein